MRAIRKETDSLHYNIFQYSPEESMDMLKSVFPDGLADEMNFCLFSTSGVHGTYSTIEDAERRLLFEDSDEGTEEVTFLVVHPRVVALRYGNVIVESNADIAFLKRLRKSSTEVINRIGYGL